MTSPDRSTPTAHTPTTPTPTIRSEQPSRLADELAAVEDSFPASDPPTYGQASIGDGETEPTEAPVRTAPEAVPADPGEEPYDTTTAEADRLAAQRADPAPDDRGEAGEEP